MPRHDRPGAGRGSPVNSLLTTRPPVRDTKTGAVPAMGPMNRRGTGITLLYAEDEQIPRDIVSSLIAGRFPEVSVRLAADGLEALDLFREHGADIVVADISMPGMDGLQLAEQVRALHPATEIVMVTAHNDAQHLLRAIRLGICHYVAKPVDRRELFSTIEKCLNRINDSAERTRAAEKIKTLNASLADRAAELEKANQELEAFNYTVSHDLRNPLANIIGVSQVLLELFAANLDENCTEFIRTIHGQARRMNRLIDTLLRFSRLGHEKLNRDTVDLSNIASGIVLELRQTEPERQAAVTIAEGVVAGCDPALLRVVLANLINNAWKYTGSKEVAEIEFGTSVQGGNAVYFVRDNGAGFDQEQADSLFVPFHRLHRKDEFRGHGIGLATVHRIIERHGGRVWAEGVPGQGATFYFTLPDGAKD